MSSNTASDNEGAVWLSRGVVRQGPGRRANALHAHIGVSVALLLFGLLGWGMFLKTTFSQGALIAQLQEDLRRTTAQRDTEIKRLSNEREQLIIDRGLRGARESAMVTELEAARRSVAGFRQALEGSRAELAAAQRELDSLRQQVKR